VNFDFTFQKLQTAHLQIPHVKKKFPVINLQSISLLKTKPVNTACLPTTSTVSQAQATPQDTVKPHSIFTMAASTAQNPAVKSESKSAKKKKASKSTSADTEPLTANPAEATPSNGPTESNNGDGSYESPYIKELYK
jgi:hypothetical protein